MGERPHLGTRRCPGGRVDFTADGAALWLTSSVGRDTTGVVRLDLSTRANRSSPRIRRLMSNGSYTNPLAKQVQAVAFNRERVTWEVIDPEMGADLDALARGAPGEFLVTNRDRDPADLGGRLRGYEAHGLPSL